MNDTNDLLEIPLPRVWRHHFSGVWFGRILGRAPFLEGHIIFEGRRVWSWTGGRLDCSQLASIGCREGDRLGDWCRVEIGIAGSIEVIPTTDALVEAARAMPVYRCGK